MLVQHRLEGIAFAADPDFNMYTTSSPFAFRRLLTPRTKTGEKLLQKTLLVQTDSGLRLRLLSMLKGQLILGKRSSKRTSPASVGMVSQTVMEVLLAVPDGRMLRRVLARLDSVSLVEDLSAPATAPLRHAAAKALTSRARRSWRSRPGHLLKRLMLRHMRRAARRRPLLTVKFACQLCFALLATPFRRK